MRSENGENAETNNRWINNKLRLVIRFCSGTAELAYVPGRELLLPVVILSHLTTAQMLFSFSFSDFFLLGIFSPRNDPQTPLEGKTKILISLCGRGGR